MKKLNKKTTSELGFKKIEKKTMTKVIGGGSGDILVYDKELEISGTRR